MGKIHSQRGLILLGFIGLGLTIAYICFRAGGLYHAHGGKADWKTYESKFFGQPVLEGITEESSVPPDMDWFHFFIPFERTDPGINPGYRHFKKRIEEKARWIRKIQHRFLFNKPVVPPDREWGYFFAFEDKRRNIDILLPGPGALGSYLSDTSDHITAFIRHDSVLLTYREKPGAKLGLFLSTQKGDEKNSMEITDVGVVICSPRKFYPFYIRRYKWKYRIILAYGGFWYIRLIVLSAIQLRRRENSSG